MCVCVCVCACVRACVFVFWTKIGIFGHERKNLGHLLINFRPTQNKYATYCRIWHICIYRSLLNIYRSLLHICRSLFHTCNVWQVYYLLSDFGGIRCYMRCGIYVYIGLFWTFIGLFYIYVGLFFKCVMYDKYTIYCRISAQFRPKSITYLFWVGLSMLISLLSQALHIGKRDLHICKRDLTMFKRDLYICKRDLHTKWWHLLSEFGGISLFSLSNMWKRPTYM